MSDLTLLSRADADVPPSGLSPLLDGHAGRNRAALTVLRVHATDDHQAIALWLAEYQGSPHTLRAYRKEAVRLWAWAVTVAGQPLSGLLRADLQQYEQFLANPDPDWCAPPGRAPQPELRRHFQGPLSPSSRRQAMNILNGLFGYLVEAGYLASNPLALRRRRRAEGVPRQTRIERYLSQALWTQVLATVDAWPDDTPRAQKLRERTRWTLRFLYGGALRLGEATAARAGDLRCESGRWWLTVVGKGQKMGRVPIADALMADYARYRQGYGLPALPQPRETTPILLPLSGRVGAPLTPAAVWCVVRQGLQTVADSLAEQQPEDAFVLRQASPHWLRHSAASHQADAGVDLRFIRDNLRHASLDTTSLYLHTEDRLRHAATTRRDGDGRDGSGA